MKNFNSVYLSEIDSLSPQHFVPQENAIVWLSEAWALNNKKHYPNDSFIQGEKKIKKLLNRYGCKPDSIQGRFTETKDFTHTNWSDMQYMNIANEKPQNDITKKNNYFHKCSLKILTAAVKNQQQPNYFLHVTCTGYSSPSAIEEITLNKRWSNQTETTHIYHMGCYASIPALRTAKAYVQSHRQKYGDIQDIIAYIFHSELCTLHFDTTNFSIEKLVIQSLFSDGYAFYQVTTNKPKKKYYYEVLSHKELLIPGSKDHMRWSLGSQSMIMTLSKEIPSIIKENIENYLIDLCKKEDLSFNDIRNKAIFAIHPGGPKIISYISQVLNLEDYQIKYSHQVLYQYGNMSSATIPHIWKLILEDNEILNETIIISIAFGPGLTIAGNLMKKLVNHTENNR